MNRAGLRVVPWVDWEEWATLREQLRSDDPRAAISTLALYRLRRPSTLPQAVQSTASLRSLLLVRGADEYSRRLGLSMAIVRLVNGATDRIQPRASMATARSVHSLAKVVSLPPVLVEIRHQATHNKLPRLDALESAAVQALHWLENDYWKPQAESIARAACKQPGSCVDAGTDNPRYDHSLLQRPEVSPRKRWRASGDPERWKSTPIGLLPGQQKVPRLLGVDVSLRIGKRWRASIVHPEESAPPISEGSAHVLDENYVSAEADCQADEVQDGDVTVRGEGIAVPPDERKGTHVLSAGDKAALQQLMQSMDDDAAE